MKLGCTVNDKVLSPRTGWWGAWSERNRPCRSLDPLPLRLASERSAATCCCRRTPDHLRHPCAPDAHQIIPKVTGCHRPLCLVVLFRPDSDLPQIAIIPHELSAALQSAVFNRHIAGERLNLAFTSRSIGTQDGNDRAGHSVTGDISKRQVFSRSAGSRGDQDRSRIRIRLPGILLREGSNTCPMKCPPNQRKSLTSVPVNNTIRDLSPSVFGRWKRARRRTRSYGNQSGWTLSRPVRNHLGDRRDAALLGCRRENRRQSLRIIGCRPRSTGRTAVIEHVACDSLCFQLRNIKLHVSPEQRVP